MPSSTGEQPVRYRLDIAEAADLEADEIYLWMTGKSAERADAWYRGLLESYEKLIAFPYSYIALPDKLGVRRMLYGKYRVTYRVVEPEPPEIEGIVRILHIYHGARQLPE